MDQTNWPRFFLDLDSIAIVQVVIGLAVTGHLRMIDLAVTHYDGDIAVAVYYHRTVTQCMRADRHQGDGIECGHENRPAAGQGISG